jgi:hypothetical protein
MFIYQANSELISIENGTGATNIHGELATLTCYMFWSL